MKRLALFLVSPLMFFIACDKDNNTSRGESIEIYRLKNTPATTIPCSVVSSAELSETPLITNNDIVWYQKNDFEFTLKDGVADRLKALKDNEPLALTIDKKVVFYCLNKPLYSSSICPDIILMGSLYTNKLYMTYVSGGAGGTSNDRRNDAQLLLTLASQGKLR